MRKILILFTIILLAICIIGCSPNIATTAQQALESTTMLKVKQTPADASQPEMPPTVSASQSAALTSPVTQPAALPTPATKDLSYADINKYPGLSFPDMAEDNSYVYYCSDAGISKLDKQTGKVKVIYQYVHPSPNRFVLDNISLSQNKLYFIQDKTIRSIDLNGNGLKILFDWDQYMALNKQSIQLNDVRDPIDTLEVNNGSLYFDSDGGVDNNYESNILEYNPTTGTLNIFIDNADNVIFNGGYAYYISQDINQDINKDNTDTSAMYKLAIYKMNSTTKEKEVVVGKNLPVMNGINNGGWNFGNFEFSNGQLYFTAIVPDQPNFKLYKYSNGSVEELYNLNDADMLTEYLGNIFFVDNQLNQEHFLFEYDHQTEKCISLSFMNNYDVGGGINIINNTIIYSSDDNKGNSAMRYIDLKNFE